MKKIIVSVLMLCLVGTTTAFAGGRHHGHGGYYDRPGKHYSYKHSRHHHRHNDGLGIALGVVGGLVLGSALASAASPPPPAVVYERPRICVQDQVVSGEWRYSRRYGRDVWVPFNYPVTRQVQVPCY